MKLSKNQREQLYNKYNGKCAYCGCQLQKSWHADHIKPIVRTWEFTGKNWDSPTKITGSRNSDLDDINNLNPSCAECNMKKSCLNIEQFRKDLSCQVQRATSKSKNFRFALKYNQVSIHETPIVFWFERYDPNLNKIL